MQNPLTNTCATEVGEALSWNMEGRDVEGAIYTAMKGNV